MADLEIHLGDSATVEKLSSNHSGELPALDEVPGNDEPASKSPTNEVHDSIAISSQTAEPAEADLQSLPESDPQAENLLVSKDSEPVQAEDIAASEFHGDASIGESSWEEITPKEEISPKKEIRAGSEEVQEIAREGNERLDNEKGSDNEAEKVNSLSSEEIPVENASSEPDNVEVKGDSIKADAEIVAKREEDKENDSVEVLEARKVVNGSGVTENGVEEARKEVDKKLEKLEEQKGLDEVDLVETPSHWHPNPCVRVTIVGGSATEEELVSIFNAHGTVSTIAFENERRDTAVVRFDSLPGDEQLVAKIQEKIHNTQLGIRTLRVEPFKADSLLFVGNLTPDIDDKLLKTMFEPHGRVERAFVLRNPAGRSKGYGFVEYSLKSQAVAAKTSMNTVIMEGRILRVEWSDCKSIRDLFSSVLFVDRITKHMPNAEASLKTFFDQYGKVKDIHLGIGVGGVSRGFAFIDFFSSADADKAKEALDGRDFGGLNLRVSFANPSKSAQSYKQRVASQGAPPTFAATGRGGVPAMQAPRGMPFGGNRFVGAGRPGAPRMAMETPYSRGTPLGPRVHDQSGMGRGSGMFGPSAPRMGMMGRPPISDNNIHQRQGMPAGGAPLPRFPSHGAQSINSGAIPQVAPSHIKAYDDEGRIRGEDYYRQGPTHQMAFDQSKQPQSQYPYHQPYQQQHPQQSHQPQPQPQPQPQQAIPQQPYHQSPQMYQQQPQQSATLQSQYQSPQQSSQYYAQPAESYPQPHQHQPSQQVSSGYYQRQPTTQEQSYNSNPQYSQQFNQPYAQTPTPQYTQQSTPSSFPNATQSYQQTALPAQPEATYSQPTYSDQQYAQNQPQQLNYERAPQTTPAATYSSAIPDSTQQQAYDSYYQQPAQSQVASGGSQVAGTQAGGQDAQWAAYYANQATYQQQPSSYTQSQQHQQPQTTVHAYPEQQTVSSGGVPVAGGVDVGQKRTYGQMDVPQQGQQQMGYTGYSSSYQQPAPYQSSAYQQAVPAYSQQPQSQSQPATYQQPAYTDGYYQQQQQQPSGFQPVAPAAQVYDYSKRPRF